MGTGIGAEAKVPISNVTPSVALAASKTVKTSKRKGRRIVPEVSERCARILPIDLTITAPQRRQIGGATDHA
jgi:hypothetical protein